MRAKSIPLLLAISALFIASCGKGVGGRGTKTMGDAQSDDGTSRSGAPVLTVTIEPLRYFTEAIAGDRFRVVSMVPRGSSPETYDPTPQQLISLANSRAYLRIGHIGFERTWCERLAQNAPDLPFLDMSQGIDFIRGAAHHHAHHAASDSSSTPDEASGSDAHGGDDLAIEPHIWNSPTNARIIARNIADALSRLDPPHAAAYRLRSDSLCTAIARTDSLVRTILSDPGADRAFLIYHPALSYFAREYGLRQFAIEADGKEPSPAHLAEIIETCASEGIRVVFIQPEFDRRNAELIARQTHCELISIDPLAYDWHAQMLRTAQALAHHLP